MADSISSAPIGIVEGEAGSPIRLKDWSDWIASDPRLLRPDPVQSVNPFNREPLVIAPHPGTAYVVEGGLRVGMMAWSEDGSDEIVVYGNSALVPAIAKEVAEQLGGRFRLLSDPERP